MDRDLCDKSNDLVLSAASLISSSQVRVRASRGQIAMGHSVVAKRSEDRTGYEMPSIRDETLSSESVICPFSC